MKRLTYVNVHGQEVDVDLLPRATRKPKAPPIKRVDDAGKAKEHHGFEVVGVPAEKLREAAAFHALQAHRAADEGKPTLALFDEAAWLAKQKPRRAISRVFTIPEAAEQAAGMLRAGGGWLRVRVVEILKG